MCLQRVFYFYQRNVFSLQLYYEFHSIQRRKFISYLSQYHQLQKYSGSQDRSHYDGFKTLHFKMTKTQNFKSSLSVPFSKITSIAMTAHSTPCCRMSTPDSQLQLHYCLAQIPFTAFSCQKYSSHSLTWHSKSFMI